MMTLTIPPDSATGTLPDDEVHVWLADTATLNDPKILGEYESLLTPEERERHRRLRVESSRHGYLVTRALVRWVLSFYADVEPKAWRFQLTEYGKPYVREPQIAIPHFNLSNTDGLVACAISASPIGIDVEKTARGVGVLALAPSIYSERERYDLMSLPEEDRPTRAIQLWTLKEAYIKALGTGLSTPLQSFDVVFDHGAVHLAQQSPPADLQENWQMAIRQIGDHQMGIARRQTMMSGMRIKIRHTVPLLRR